MKNTPHELSEEFPEFTEKMHQLKLDDNHFVKLADEYHELNREVHRLEIGEQHLSHFEEEQLRKKRMLLKDEIFTYLTKD
ncbi:MAG: DUF465 domain-containing protein [Hyphomicrobiales bacterium]